MGEGLEWDEMEGKSRNNGKKNTKYDSYKRTDLRNSTIPAEETWRKLPQRTA